MSQDYNNPAFKKLLAKLQEESWQLELIISGFAIFGLYQAFEPVKLSMVEAENGQHISKFIIYLVGYAAISILLFNLLLHVLLRGLWIGALGLRYISGDIDYDSLNYSPKFTKYLKKKVGSFDRYIARLEDYCSVIFAISFLLIFYVIAIVLTILAITLVANYVLDNDDLPGWISGGVGIFLILFFVFGMFFTMIDFITQGWLKKKKWISRIYFPIYWVFSFVTLSFLYRPLVYNFLDNKFGKRLSFVLIPVYLIILTISSLEYQQSNYIVTDDTSSANHLNKNHYEDLLKDSNDFMDTATIQSKVIEDPYLKLFMAYSEGIENRIFNTNESLRPEEDQRGLGFGFTVTSNNGNFFVNSRKRDSLTSEYLKTFNDIYDIKIDSLYYEADFLITKNHKEQLGFETYVDINDLQKGKHTLKIIRDSKRKDTVVKVSVVSIPFWYFPN
ncbi:hypothetical protein U0L90_06715 [Flavobacteriaceae sp. LMIT009]